MIEARPAVVRHATGIGMTVYHALYNPGTAALIVTLSWIALTSAQARVVFDALHFIHKSWGSGFVALAAFGYEVATLGVGLVLSVVGAYRRDEQNDHGGLWPLWLALALFLIVSGWFGFDSAMRSGLPAGDGYVAADLLDVDAIVLARALLAGAALPAQYLLAVMAGHQLAKRTGIAERRPASSDDVPSVAPLDDDDGDDVPNADPLLWTTIRDVAPRADASRDDIPARRYSAPLLAMRELVAERQRNGDRTPTLSELREVARVAAGGIGWSSNSTVDRNLERAGLTRGQNGDLRLI